MARIRLPRRRRTAEIAPLNAARELAYRVNDGIHVLLLWHPADDSVSISVDDTKNGTQFAVPVSREKALFAFHHPFAYAT